MFPVLKNSFKKSAFVNLLILKNPRLKLCSYLEESSGKSGFVAPFVLKVYSQEIQAYNPLDSWENILKSCCLLECPIL